MAHRRPTRQSTRTLRDEAAQRLLLSTLALMNRTAALDALLNITVPISEAIAGVTSFAWDSESELVVLLPEHFCRALLLFNQGALSAAEIEEWANALECRDDVRISTTIAHELLHELANPLLTRSLSKERASFWLSQLALSANPSINTDAAQ